MGDNLPCSLVLRALPRLPSLVVVRMRGEPGNEATCHALFHVTVLQVTESSRRVGSGDETRWKAGQEPGNEAI